MVAKKISSTRVRQLIREGNVKEANNLLGHEFSTRGIVVHGDARGRTIGFPTANLAPIDRTILPADGVYVADVVIDGKRYRSMTSLGKTSLLVVQSYVLKPISLILKVIYMEKQSKSSG